jgi:hypothetical protein
VWSKRLGSERVSLAADTEGAVYLAGNTYDVFDLGGGPLGQEGKNSLFTAKLDAAGAHVYSRAFLHGDKGASFMGAAVDGEGNLYVTGFASPPVDLGGGELPSADLSQDLAAKFDPSGAHIWSRRLGTGFNRLFSRIALGPAGDVAIAGSFEGTLALCAQEVKSQATPDAFVAVLQP